MSALSKLHKKVTTMLHNAGLNLQKGWKICFKVSPSHLGLLNEEGLPKNRVVFFFLFFYFKSLQSDVQYWPRATDHESTA